MPSRSWSLGEWLNYWLEHIVEPEGEHNTYVKYESKVRLYLLPHLGKKPLIRLTPAHLRSFMAVLKREKVGAATRFEVLRVLRNALNRAMREELLTRNVALLVDMPKVSKDKGTAWNAREAIAFLRPDRAHRLYAACVLVLVLVLGLRRIEVLGLRWKDIDFEAGRFTPVKQVQREGRRPGP
ncbi:site-specific integrase [Streptomyces sp. NPDC054962]